MTCTTVTWGALASSVVIAGAGAAQVPRIIHHARGLGAFGQEDEAVGHAALHFLALGRATSERDSAKIPLDW
jgi:hypothetical protein